MRSAEQMREVFARFEKSGLSLKAFGEREGITYTSLQYWRRRLRDDERGKTTGQETRDSVALAPVRVVPAPAVEESRSPSFEVWLSNGVSLEVRSGFEEEELRRLVGVLSAC